MPQSISSLLKIPVRKFKATGAFDAVLDVDSLFFIDPKLLEATKVPEFKDAHAKVIAYFDDILRLLSASKTEGDLFWKQADRMFSFSEVQGLCIGYASSGTAGSGMGKGLRNAVLKTTKAIMDAGIKDPALFEIMGVFQEDIGPDRISDMIARILAHEIRSYSQRVFKTLGCATTKFTYRKQDYQLVLNPHNRCPVILLPAEFLRDLPVAYSIADVSTVCNHNQELREEINALVRKAFAQFKNRMVPKWVVRELIKGNPSVLKNLLAAYKQAKALPYDFENDPAGEIIWYEKSIEAVKKIPLQAKLSAKPSLIEVKKVVHQICLNFKQLIEHNGLSDLLYDTNGQHKRESASQKLFLGIASAYCEANNLDLSPEANAGRGPVDFKISSGFFGKVLVETKLTTNNQLVHGFETQEPEYLKAEQTKAGFYIVIDNGGPQSRIDALKQKILEKHSSRVHMPTVIFIDGIPKESASKFELKASRI